MPMLQRTGRPPPENKPATVCLWRGCTEPASAHEEGGATLWCAAHRDQVLRDWGAVLLMSPGYRRYYEGKED